MYDLLNIVILKPTPSKFLVSTGAQLSKFQPSTFLSSNYIIALNFHLVERSFNGQNFIVLSSYAWMPVVRKAFKWYQLKSLTIFQIYLPLCNKQAQILLKASYLSVTYIQVCSCRLLMLTVALENQICTSSQLRMGIGRHFQFEMGYHNIQLICTDATEMIGSLARATRSHYKMG